MKKFMFMLALCMSTYVYAEETSKVSVEITDKINRDKKSIEALAKERQDSVAKIAALKTEIGKLEIYVDIIDKETVTIKHAIDNNNKKLAELQNPQFEVLSAPVVPNPSVNNERVANKDISISDNDKKADTPAKEEVKEVKKPKKRVKKEPKPPSQKHSQDLANMINQISSGNIKKK